MGTGRIELYKIETTSLYQMGFAGGVAELSILAPLLSLSSPVHSRMRASPSRLPDAPFALAATVAAPSVSRRWVGGWGGVRLPGNLAIPSHLSRSRFYPRFIFRRRIIRRASTYQMIRRDLPTRSLLPISKYYTRRIFSSTSDNVKSRTQGA